MTYIFLTVLFIIIICVGLSCKMLYVPKYKGAVSDHFDGKKFSNDSNWQMGSFSELMRYQIKNKKAKWPDLSISDIESPQVSEPSSDEIRYVHINHATVLIQFNGINILTDPVFVKRASPFQWNGPKRHRPPSIALEDLPKIDIIVISHDHYDHLDTRSLVRLSAKFQPDILVGLGLKTYLEKWDIPQVHEMDWNDSIELKGTQIHFLTAIHWSNRAVSPFRTLWGSYLFQANGSTVYFAGDTAYGDHFTDVREKFGHIDLALIPIGAYVPRSFMKYVHMPPEDAIKAHLDLTPTKSLGIHWGTFQLTGEGMYAPIEELEVLCKDQKIENFDVDREHNQVFSIPFAN